MMAVGGEIMPDGSLDEGDDEALDGVRDSAHQLS